MWVLMFYQMISTKKMIMSKNTKNILIAFRASLIH